MPLSRAPRASLSAGVAEVRRFRCGGRGLAALLSAAALAACQTTPGPGGVGRVQVDAVPRTRAEVPVHPRVDAALDGLAEAIRAGRLLRARCVSPEAGSWTGVRVQERLVLLPDRRAAREGEVARLRAAPAGLPDTVALLDGVVAAGASTEWVTYRPGGGTRVLRELRCETGPGGLPARVVLGPPVAAWEQAYAQAERARHAQFSDAELAAGRIGLGRCALRDVAGDVYYQPQWLFRVPPEARVQPGDVVELRFGAAEQGGDDGPIAVMRRRLGTRADFPAQGPAAVDCH